MKAQSLDSEAIRERAYHKWLQAGAPEGDGAAFWLAAENELAEERRNTSADPPGNLVVAEESSVFHPCGPGMIRGHVNASPLSNTGATWDALRILCAAELIAVDSRLPTGTEIFTSLVTDGTKSGKD